MAPKVFHKIWLQSLSSRSDQPFSFVSICVIRGPKGFSQNQAPLQNAPYLAKAVPICREATKKSFAVTLCPLCPPWLISFKSVFHPHPREGALKDLPDYPYRSLHLFIQYFQHIPPSPSSPTHPMQPQTPKIAPPFPTAS